MKRIVILSTILLIITQSYISGKPLLTLISPNGGEKLKSGTSVQILWKYNEKSSDSGIILVLYKEGIKFLTISESVTDSGSYFWEIPENIPPGEKYRIRIRSSKDLGINDFSDNDFSILNK